MYAVMTRRSPYHAEMQELMQTSVSRSYSDATLARVRTKLEAGMRPSLAKDLAAEGAALGRGADWGAGVRGIIEA